MLKSFAYPRIFYRYIVSEIFSPFWVALFVFTGALFLARILKLVDLVVNKNVPIGDILLLFAYVVPRFLGIAIPMALLLSVILAFGRLSSDSELIVMRCTGLSFRQLSIPVLLFALFSLIATLVMGFWITPWANYQLGRGLFEIAKKEASSGLTPGIFNELGQLTIYAEKIDRQSGRLQHVIIADRRESSEPRNFVAKNGRIVSDDKARTLNLQLYDGNISEGVGLDYNLTDFQINGITLPHSELMEEGPSKGGKKSDEMYINELLVALDELDTRPTPLNKEERKQRARYAVEFHQRLAIPLSCLFVGLIAMALGVHPTRGGKSWSASANMVLGISVILGYFLVFATASAFGSQDVGPVWAIMWLPNVIIAALALIMFQRMGSERWMAVSESLGRLCSILCQRLNIAK